MNKSHNATAKNVLDTQQGSASENEESDSVTDQSSSMSERTSATTAAQRHQSSKNVKATKAKTTQFSVQRSDVDGLRMKISAIRPANFKVTNSTKLVTGTVIATAILTNNIENKTNVKIAPQTAASDKFINNNNIVESLKVKIINNNINNNNNGKQTQQKVASSKCNMSVDAVAEGATNTAATTQNPKRQVSSNSLDTITATTSSVAPVTTAATVAVTTTAAVVSGENHTTTMVSLPLTLLTQVAPCLSDATESGCSEATTTTVAACNEKMTKKVKVKRKKVQLKSTNDAKKSHKKSRVQTVFSSDSEDDKPLKLHAQQKQQPLQQRAPRLLITAINAKIGSSATLKPLNSLPSTTSVAMAVTQGGSDNIGLSSSDNELPDLVSAAIKRVESDTDDTCDTGGFRKARTKQLPQYQSTLLQDFMEKTQMLGHVTSAANATTPSVAGYSYSAAHATTVATNCNSQQESPALSSDVIVKKRRGRPKKQVPTVNNNTHSAIVAEIKPTVPIATNNAHINESGDSGVISTTSTTQSTSPSPKMSSVSSGGAISGATKRSNTPTAKQRRVADGSNVARSETKVKGAEVNAKPKIDMSYLDKRMYATERVLYPPPRNKRRQFLNAAVKTSISDKKPNIGSGSPATCSAKLTKDELQLDPVWRKIDVNKKFRRPSVSGYKSDGGGVNTTICSKVLAAKSGYVSDYGSCHLRSRHHNSGYKSDASGKSRYSTKSSASRRSRAKSCGYRSDCKESVGLIGSGSTKSTKFRRKRRCSLVKAHSKSVGNLNDDQDILQLAGLSLGQSSEESNEYVCKPSLEQLPTTSVLKKYGEINRYIATGEYFGRGSRGGAYGSFGGLQASKRGLYDEGSQDGFAAMAHSFSGSSGSKLLLQRKHSLATELAHALLPPHPARKIKSRRSSIASYCSSHYSGTSRIRRRRRRRSFRFPSSGKTNTIDSKLLTEIDIITSTFGAMCRIQSGGGIGSVSAASLGSGSVATNMTFTDKALSSGKEKLLAEANKLQHCISGTSAGSKRETRDKRLLKKRKMSENLDFALLSAAAGGSNACGNLLLPISGISTKRRHKKASSSSPDDHKLPLKKRHYLLTPGEKSTEAAKLFGSNEAWVAAAVAGKTSVSSKATQQQLAAAGVSVSGKGAKAGLTPKKRHLLQNAAEDGSGSGGSSLKGSNSSPLRIVVDTHSLGGSSKFLDISPLSQSGSSKQSADIVHKKRTRLEGLVSKIATATGHVEEVPSQQSSTIKESTISGGKQQQQHFNRTAQVDSEGGSCPPPGIFEPSVELEIQIPPLSRLTEVSASGGIIAKSEVESPLLLELHKGPSSTGSGSSTKTESTRGVVESLLNKTGGNLILRRKRKKINRTGFPTIKRKKRKTSEQMLLDIVPEEETVAVSPTVQKLKTQKAALSASTAAASAVSSTISPCDRVPQAGETSDTFLERANRTPRLSVVALERLQGTPTTPTTTAAVNSNSSRNPKHQQQKELEKAGGRQKRRLNVKLTPTKNKDTPRQLKVETPVSQMKRSKLLRTEAPVEQTAAGVIVNNTRSPRGRKPVIKSISQADEQPIAHTHTATAKANKLPSLAIRKPHSSSGKMSDKPAFTKSSVQQIITAKSLEAKVKLPAGIDPNTNFSCKIRLKRRSSMHPAANSKNNAKEACVSATQTAPDIPTPCSKSKNKEEQSCSSAEEVAAEAAAKDIHTEQLEHDVLPISDGTTTFHNDSEASYDTSDEKSSCNSNATVGTTGTNSTARKVAARFRKNYLPAGLFSNYFKLEANIMTKSLAGTKKSTTDKREDGTSGTSVIAPISADGSDITNALSLLPPPPYCEKYFRRSEVEFQLPYDIWWAYKHDKLPLRNTVPSWNYRKIRTNVYADSVRPNLAGFDHPICNCKSDAACGDNCLNRMVYTECSPSTCPTRDKCSNQKIQRHEVAPGVERFMTENKGWGVRTKLPISKGTYILEYVGEVVTEREFKNRMGTFYLNDTHHYCLHLDGGLVIDGHRMGSDGRFVNHSCEPNCEMQKWSVNGLSRMALFAKRHIETGEELTYDYNFSLFNPSEGQPCRCNTPQCRGVIGGKWQRIKPLPIEAKPRESSSSPKDARNGRQRKRKARKNTQRLQSKDVVVARVQQLSEKEKKLVKQHGIFLVRNFEKIRRCKAKRAASSSEAKINSNPSPMVASPLTTGGGTPAAIAHRRPSTPSTFAAQMSALCSARNIKTRGLTLAVQDPEVEKMAKMAVILRDICTALETLQSSDDEKITLISLVLSNTSGNGASSSIGTSGAAAGNKKKKALKPQQKQEPIDLKTVQSNIEQGYYKLPVEFDEDMDKIFADSKVAHTGDEQKLQALEKLIATYVLEKQKSYAQLLEVMGDEMALVNFKTKGMEQIKATNEERPSTDTGKPNTINPADTKPESIKSTTDAKITPTEDIIRCICGLYKDEGLMIQCTDCMVWQHTECTKADVHASDYHCERCVPREVDREIPLEDFTEEGHRYYLSLMRGELHVRQGDAVYVLRDIPIKDAGGNVIPSKKHTYETIGHIDYQECDIFRVERLWKNEEGKRFIFGHHFLRPHETFHEPSRRFYPNEVVRVPLYEVVPIELVIGRCWVLDRTTFCKGRPIECLEEEHCYICELRVDKSARFFSKAKVSYPTCTKSYAFKKFDEKLKISKTYAPHEVDPSMLKTKKQKTDSNEGVCAGSTSTSSAASTPANNSSTGRQDLCKTSHATRKRQTNNSPVTVHLISPVPPTVQTIKVKRTRLENVLRTIKLKWKNTQLAAEPVIDLSYLLSGRGARQRKTFTTVSTSSSSTASVPA